MSQIKIVKGNDAPIQWRVSYQGQPLDLTGKAVTLYVINSRGPFQLKSFEVEGNVVTATYYGADQTRFGEHSLVLRLNEGAPEMSTVAVKEAFELVEWSKDQGGESGEPIKVTPIILEADFAIAPKVDVDPSNYYTKDEANAAFQPKGNYLPREEFEERIEGYATHDRVQKLSENVTELSTQVGGLSERVEDLEQGGQGGEQEVFKAEYGVTTFAEVKAANEAGKVVICNYNGYVFRLTRVMDSELTFVANNVGYIHLLYLTKFDVWWSNYADVRHELKNLDNGNVQLTIAGKSAEVATPQYVENALQQSGGGASKEWKCVYDGRLEVGQMQIESTTYADGTPLDAEELVVQVIMESSEGVTQPRQGYVEINSSLNKNKEQYGAIYFEKPSLTNPAISMIRLKASPFIMVADVLDAAPIAVAQGGNLLARAGRYGQIYENISYVRVYSTQAIQAIPPIIKIYAR